MIGHLFALLLCLKHVLNEVVLSFKTSLKQTGSDIIDLSVCEHVYFFSCQQTVFNSIISTGGTFSGLDFWLDFWLGEFPLDDSPLYVSRWVFVCEPSCRETIPRVFVF